MKALGEKILTEMKLKWAVGDHCFEMTWFSYIENQNKNLISILLFLLSSASCTPSLGHQAKTREWGLLKGDEIWIEKREVGFIVGFWLLFCRSLWKGESSDQDQEKKEKCGADIFLNIGYAFLMCVRPREERETWCGHISKYRMYMSFECVCVQTFLNIGYIFLACT